MGTWKDKPLKLYSTNINWCNCVFFDLLKIITPDFFDEFKNKKKLFISDCDGILTSGRSLYSKSGKSFKEYGSYDKEAIEFATMLNWEFEFVTGDSLGSKITFKRLKDLKSRFKDQLRYSLKNYRERFELVKEAKAKYDIVCFIGDSYSDILAINEADYSGTTNNAPNIVKRYCNYVSELTGGDGGFADIIFSINMELLTKGQNKNEKRI